MKPRQPGAAPPPFFYGWVIVGISFVMQAIGVGNQYITGLLFQPLQDRLQAGAALVSLATMSAMTAVVALASPLCGALLRRYPLRPFVVAGFLAVAAGYVGLAHAQSLWQIALIYATCFAAGAMIALIAGATLVSNWFVRRRGFAQGIATAGASAAGCLIPPAVTYGFERLGVETTCLLVALAAAALAPAAWKLLVERPDMLGELPDGAAMPAAEPARPGTWTLSRLIAHPRFWVLAILGALTNAVTGVLAINIMQLAQHAFASRLDASYLMSYSLASALVGAILIGRLFDAQSQRAIALTTLAIAAAPCLLLLGQPGAGVVVVSSLLIGVGVGVAVLAPNVLIARSFGQGDFSLVLGAMNPFIMGGFALALPLFGLAHDVLGSYDTALLCFAAALLLAAALACALPGAARLQADFS